MDLGQEKLEERNCSIWICTDDTQEECLKRQLFGTSDRGSYFYNKVRCGDVCFLLNIESNKLFGVFIAKTDPGWELEPDAWGSRFPYQIRVQPVNDPESRSDARNILRNAGIQITDKGYPKYAVYGPEITNRLLKHFSLKVSPPPAPEPSALPLKGFDRVAGLEDAKRYIKERMLVPFEDPVAAKVYGLKFGGGLLLFGPPGTGKTLLAKATADEIDAAFYEITPSVVRGYPGDPEKHLEQLFNEAMKNPRSVIFIDECDALLARKDLIESSTVMQRVIPVFLSLFSRVSECNAPVLIIGATNKPWDIDEAFLRPGRFDYVCPVGLPDLKGRIELLQLKLRDKPVEDGLMDERVLERLAQRLEGWSGADVELLIQRVAYRKYQEYLKQRHGDEDEATIREKGPKISESDINRIIEEREIMPSVSGEIVSKYEEWCNKVYKVWHKP